MTVPDGAVEAAARAMAQFDEWEHVSADRKSNLRRTAKRALTAAAPFIAAQAWEEGAEAAWSRSTPVVNHQNYKWRTEGEPGNPYRKTT